MMRSQTIKMNCIQIWPEPVVRVQSLSESGITSIPDRYIKPPSQRPSFPNNVYNSNNIPVIDLQDLLSSNQSTRESAMSSFSSACREWGFFQIVNHGIDLELMRRARETWRDFFGHPLEVKQQYSNSPTTYEGYGSRVGVEKGAILDWSDYFFLHFMPLSLRNPHNWPLSPSYRSLMVEYGNEQLKLCEKLMKLLSISLGLEEEQLPNAFGGENIGACLRANFYPKCPQPHLTLGLSSHSDPGGLTLLLPDEDVAGLQVLKDGTWITINSLPNAFIVNIADQIQVLSNGIYKSVEHRVIANSEKDRVSLAFFYNPNSELIMEPIKELVTEEMPALYHPMTFDEYRLFIRTKGPCGKKQIDSLKSI